MSSDKAGEMLDEGTIKSFAKMKISGTNALRTSGSKIPEDIAVERGRLIYEEITRCRQCTDRASVMVIRSESERERHAKIFDSLDRVSNIRKSNSSSSSEYVLKHKCTEQEAPTSAVMSDGVQTLRFTKCSCDYATALVLPSSMFIDYFENNGLVCMNSLCCLFYCRFTGLPRSIHCVPGDRSHLRHIFGKEHIGTIIVANRSTQNLLRETNVRETEILIDPFWEAEFNQYGDLPVCQNWKSEEKMVQGIDCTPERLIETYRSDREDHDDELAMAKLLEIPVESDYDSE